MTWWWVVPALAVVAYAAWRWYIIGRWMEAGVCVYCGHTIEAHSGGFMRKSFSSCTVGLCECDIPLRYIPK